MLSDFKYNFGFVAEEISELRYTVYYKISVQNVDPPILIWTPLWTPYGRPFIFERW